MMMQSICKFALVFGLAFGSSAVGISQTDKKREYVGSFALMLVYNKAAVADLKLTKEELANAIQAIDTVADKYKKELEDVRDDKGKWPEVAKKVGLETEKALRQVLAPRQIKRMEQINMQIYYHQTLLAPENAKE